MFPQVFRHYSEWEEHYAGLWRKVCGSERDKLVEACSKFMANTERFRFFMFRIIEAWPVSCEVNFTTPGLNRQAWLGHAACCMAINCPEEPTRCAWWTLTEKQRNDADAAAAEAIATWESNYRGDTRCQSDQLGLTF